MENEFIPYEQALALKELGFDEPCVLYWRPEMDGSMHMFCHSDCYFWDAIGSNNSDNAEWVTCTAPLYQQAFRWFREKYKLYHNIKMFGDWDKPQYSYIISGRTMINPAHMWYYKDVNSYPEAELACLKKLIEIVKQ